MEVVMITILRQRHGADQLDLETQLPNGIWPFEGHASVTMKVAAGQGEEYVSTHFPGIPVKVIADN